ncbi:MAG: PGPGW domain-containing protein [Actinomycetota bacterium]
MKDDAHHEHERFDEIVDAAIEAEFETGVREETVEEAKAHILVRLARMTLGFAVLLVGIAMLALPGPGLVTIGAGLLILSRDVAWADRLLQRVRHRLPQDADGSIPRSAKVTIAFSAVGAVAISTWFVLIQ